MTKKIQNDNTEQLVGSIIEGIQELKGKSVVKIDLKEIKNTICDYFIICEGDSNVHVSAIADSVERFAFLQLKEKPRHIEGLENAHWVLLDFFGIVVHIFQSEYRNFYKLEDLWSDGKLVKIDD